MSDAPIPSRYDLHAHSTYSDGSPMGEMVAAGRRAGLDGVGIADHCIVVQDRHGRRDRYDLVETFERRRADIKELRPVADIEVFDAAEVSYVADAEAETAAFLERADFDYVIGSVHFAGPYQYTGAAQYADADRAGCRSAVDRYFEAQRRLVESELFEVAGHIDLVQRIPALRDLTTDSHYEALADAFASSRTIPEINAGRLTRRYGEIHPEPARLDYLRERGIEFTIGTDSHRPEELEDRISALTDRGVEADTYPV